MTNYYKLSGQDLYWKIIDETTTVYQIKKTTDASSASKTTGTVRYNALMQYVSTWEASNETEFNTILAEINSDINN